MLAILTACYGRHEVFNIFLKSLPQDAYLICVGDKDENLNLFEESKIKGTYIIHKNKPISDKWNYGLQFARNVDFSHLVITGSDDVFSADLWDWYKTLDVQYAGLLDIYFMNYPNVKIKYCDGFRANRQGEPHGAGRAFTREVLESVNWQLWDNGLDIGLDASMTERLRHVNTSPFRFIKLQSKGFVAIDIKTKENLHQINEYNGTWIDQQETQWVLNKIGWTTR